MRVDRARTLRWAALLLTVGLAVQVFTLRATSPASFVFFILGGGGLVGLGAALSLMALLRADD